MGSDIFRELSRRLNDRGGASCFFQGSTEETLPAIENRLAGEFLESFENLPFVVTPAKAEIGTEILFSFI